VVGHRQRVVRALVAHEADDLVRPHLALERQEAPDRDVGDRPAALVAEDGDAVDPRDVDGGARRVVRDVARGREVRAATMVPRAREGEKFL